MLRMCWAVRQASCSKLAHAAQKHYVWVLRLHCLQSLIKDAGQGVGVGLPAGGCVQQVVQQGGTAGTGAVGTCAGVVAVVVVGATGTPGTVWTGGGALLQTAAVSQ
jgi:hypothetical protein